MPSNDTFRLLFLGDIFAEAGRKVASYWVPRLKEELLCDLVVANIENVAGGLGITPKTYNEMMDIGIDVCTGGNHSFDKKDGYDVMAEESNVLRPANYPPGLPGRGYGVYESVLDGTPIGIMNLIGRSFMLPFDCPFRMADTLLSENKGHAKLQFVDFHAEATAEKYALAWHLDGRVSAFCGTHTHVQTADERILTKGTAYLTDVGMCGPYNSVIGISSDIVIEKFMIGRGRKFEPAKENPWLCGAFICMSKSTRKGISIKRVRLDLDKSKGSSLKEYLDD